MKALVIAERADAARELCAGARTMADEVVLVSFGEAPEAVADKIARISVPEGTVDDAADTVISVFDAEAPAVVLVEPTRHMKTIAGKLAAHANASVITDVMSFENGAVSLYFGGVAERVQKAAGDVAIYTVGAGAFEGAEASGANAVEDVAWVAPATPVKLVSSKPIEKSGVDLNKADVVVAAGRGFAEESELDLARELCDKLGAGLACSRPLTEGVNWLAAHGGLQPRGHDVRHQQGQERSGVQAVRLRHRGRRQGRPAEAGRGAVRPLDPPGKGSATPSRSDSPRFAAELAWWAPQAPSLLLRPSTPRHGGRAPLPC